MFPYSLREGDCVPRPADRMRSLNQIAPALKDVSFHLLKRLL